MINKKDSDLKMKRNIHPFFKMIIYIESNLKMKDNYKSFFKMRFKIILFFSFLKMRKTEEKIFKNLLTNII